MKLNGLINCLRHLLAASRGWWLRLRSLEEHMLSLEAMDQQSRLWPQLQGSLCQGNERAFSLSSSSLPHARHGTSYSPHHPSVNAFLNSGRKS